MKKAKEELALSAIFVAKWLTLAIGALVLIFLVISLAYNQIVVAPSVRHIDLDIEILNESIDRNNDAIEQKQLRLSQIGREKDGLESEMRKTEESLQSAEKALEELDPDWLDRIPFIERDPGISKGYEALEEAQNEIKRIANAIDERVDEQTTINKEINDLLEENQEALGDIAKKSLEKREIQAGNTWLRWLWLLFFT